MVESPHIFGSVYMFLLMPQFLSLIQANLPHNLTCVFKVGSVKFIPSMQQQLKKSKKQRNNRSVAEEKHEEGQERVEGDKGTRGEELETKTRLAVTALEDHGILGMGLGRVGDSSPAAAGEQMQDVPHKHHR